MRKARAVRRTDETPEPERGTEPRAVAEGRNRFKLSLESARAMIAASQASGFPPPPQALAVVEAAEPVTPVSAEPTPEA